MEDVIIIGGRELEEALAGLRRLAIDREFLWQHLMFIKSLETPPLLGASPWRH